MCFGRDKYLHLVKAGNEYILIASSSKGLEMLGKIDVDQDIDKETEEEGTGRAGVAGSFKNIFSNYINRNLNWYNDNKANEEQLKDVDEKK